MDKHVLAGQDILFNDQIWLQHFVCCQCR